MKNARRSACVLVVSTNRWAVGAREAALWRLCKWQNSSSCSRIGSKPSKFRLTVADVLRRLAVDAVLSGNAVKTVGASLKSHAKCRFFGHIGSTSCGLELASRSKRCMALNLPLRQVLQCMRLVNARSRAAYLTWRSSWAFVHRGALAVGVAVAAARSGLLRRAGAWARRHKWVLRAAGAAALRAARSRRSRWRRRLRAGGAVASIGLTTDAVGWRAGAHLDHITPEVVSAQFELVHLGVELRPDRLDVVVDGDHREEAYEHRDAGEGDRADRRAVKRHFECRDLC